MGRAFRIFISGCRDVFRFKFSGGKISKSPDAKNVPLGEERFFVFHSRLLLT